MALVDLKSHQKLLLKYKFNKNLKNFKFIKFDINKDLDNFKNFLNKIKLINIVVFLGPRNGS